MQRVPEIVTADVPNFIDLRVIGMAVDENEQEYRHVSCDVDEEHACLPYTTSCITGRLMADGSPVDVYSPIMTFTVPALDPEEKPANASAAVAR